MRGTIEGLDSRHPLAVMLPSLFQQEDRARANGVPFVQDFCNGLDTVVAPAYSVLDNLFAYFDPMLTPPDFVDWLSGWVGVDLDENWPLDHRRRLVADAHELYRWRGTVRGVRALVEIYTGAIPEVEDSGGVSWSRTPGAAVPGSADAHVRVRVAAGESVDARRLDRIVADAKPAHIAHTVEVIAS